jgi:hypothetical protein
LLLGWVLGRARSPHVLARNMSDADCIDEVVTTVDKCNDPSTPTPIPSPPPRSTFKSIVLVLTVTFAMIINVGCLALVVSLQWLDALFFTKPIIIDCELFSFYDSITNDTERVGLGRSTSPMDRIGLLFKFGV